MRGRVMNGGSSGDGTWTAVEDATPGLSPLHATVYQPAPIADESAPGLMLFLHGMGESGVDGRAHLGVGLPPAIRRNPERWPFVVLCPQKPTREEEWEDSDTALMALLDRAIDEHDIDPRRVGIAGLSQGGHGTWEIARRHPDRFQLVAPICGYPAAPRRGWANFDSQVDWTLDQARAAAANVAQALHDKSIWVAHGAKDPIVPVAFADAVVEALRARGADPRYDRLAGVTHDSWSVTYAKAEYSAWFRDELRAR
jgi:predicted peptidase